MSRHTGRIERVSYDTMYEYVVCWCHECRRREQLVTGEHDPDMSRFAMLLTPAEYCEFLNDTRSLCFMSFRPQLFGVAILSER